MSRKVLILVLLLCFPFFMANAQLFDPEHRLSVQALVGTSPVHTLMEKYKEELPEGSSYRNLLAPAATIGAEFDLNEKWTIQGGINLSRAIFEITRPEEAAPARENGTVTFTGLFAVHYMWVRRDYFRVYSGVGVAMSPKVMMATFFPSPIPSITPIGASVEFSHIYLTAEITAGGNSVGGVAGLGFRF